MAYTPDFEYDIFISYAHVDNQVIHENKKGWVDVFLDQLEKYINGQIGKIGAIKIWKDDSIDGNQFFDETIKETISKSALFLSIMSNGYLNSDYCNKELEFFNQKVTKDNIGLKIGDRSRIFNILLANINYNSFPECIAGTTGFVFHDADKSDDDDIGYPMKPESDIFTDKIRRLVNSIFKCLRDLNNKLKSEQELQKKSNLVKSNLTNLNFTKSNKDAEIKTIPEVDKTFPVFFSEVSDTLRPTQKRAINDLQEKGVYVMKHIPPPFDPVSDHDKEILKVLNKAKLTVHMFDEISGKEIPEIPDQTYSSRQFDLCAEKSCYRLIWTPKNIKISEIEEEPHKKFLNNLDAILGTNNTELIRGNNKNEIFSIVLETIDTLKKSQIKEVSKEPAVLIDTHQKDNGHLDKLINYFLENNINFRLNYSEDEPKAKMDIFKEHLKNVNTLIFVYGIVKQKWLISRFGIISNLILTKKYPVKNKAIFLAPPNKENEKKELEDMIIGPVQFIDNSFCDDLNKEQLTPLLNSIKCRGEK